MELTKEDWVEIYYALDSKRSHLDTIGKGAPGDWPRHLEQIMEKIGPDGKTAAAAGREKKGGD